MKKVIAIAVAAVIMLSLVLLTGCADNKVEDLTDALTTTKSASDKDNTSDSMSGNVTDDSTSDENDASSALGDLEDDLSDITDESSSKESNTDRAD